MCLPQGICLYICFQYLGSTPVIFSQNQKTVRMQQAREAVRLLKVQGQQTKPVDSKLYHTFIIVFAVQEAQDDTQPRIDVDLKINIKDLVMADRKTGVNK